LHEYDKAITDFSKAIKLNPKNAIFYNNLDVSYYDLHEFNKAVDAYSRAIYIDSNMSAAYSNRASAYYALGDYTNSENDSIKAKDFEKNK
jgi:tetratricopeptide (TPR) repeat protein